MSFHFEKLDQLTRTLRGFIYRDPRPLTGWRLVDRLPYDALRPAPSDPRWRDLADDEWWGGHQLWAYLTAPLEIPPAFTGRPAALHVEFEAQPTGGGALYSDPEALVHVDGLPTRLQALNYSHSDVLLTEQAEPGRVEITLACFTGVALPGDLRLRFKTAELVWIDRPVEALYWDARILLDAVRLLPEDSPERIDHMQTLDAAFQALNWLNPPDEAFAAGVTHARAILAERLYRPADPQTHRPTVHAIGHAHIDLAWLWPLRVTRGKGQRTFSTAIDLMARFPDYRFTQTSPALYQMIAEDDPDLFAQIKSQIAAGRWNATGATWVEMDANLPAGEALVRQFLFGMRYFQKELGIRPEVLWLPDGFGFTAALPQLMRQAGVPYFFTNKLSWNAEVKQPYDTFWWEGLDGSRVLAHLGTTPETSWDVGRARDYTTYVGVMSPEEIQGTWRRYKQKEANRQLLIPFGMGDGGGGPNRDMIARRARLANLAGLPQVIHNSAEGFFHALEENLTGELPRWVGELYLQFHRGTYTSQGRTKRLNRQVEGLLHDVEALGAIASQLGAADYPRERLLTAWETLLLNQFHDILPGSSVHEVHVESEDALEGARAALAASREELLAALAEAIITDGNRPALAVFNTLGSTLGGPTEITLPQIRNGAGEIELQDPAGQTVPLQWLDRESGRALIRPDRVPAYGFMILTAAPAAGSGAPPAKRVTGTPNALENDLLRAEFDDRGNLTRLFDREHGRELLAAGAAGNQLWCYVDRPTQFDAWEIERFVHDQGWRLEPDGCQLVEDGPLRAALQVTYRFNRSTIVQRISLMAGERLLSFATSVDWHERHILLQVHFPLAIRAMQATYEVQFGAVTRPTHENTIWDRARFEVPALQWADLSEAGCGVSLLNDGKYGHSARDNVLTLSLLRSPTDPDPEADQGSHQFTYALYPHTAGWQSGTVWQARRLNQPLLTRPLSGSGKTVSAPFSFIRCSAAGVIVDTVKQAEDGHGLIVRVYEAHGGRTAAVLTFPSSITAAAAVNILEEPAAEAVDVQENALHFEMTPFQIRSFKVNLAGFPFQP